MDAKLLVLVGLLICGLGTIMAAPPPNVVMIIGDDQSWGDYGFMGHPVIRTPHLDRFASQSLVYTHGYVSMSLCRPSLATLITGLYPHQSKIATNYPWNHPTGYPLDERPFNGSREGKYWRRHQEMIRYIQQVPTLPRLLAERGYKSWQGGKWWEGHYSNGGFTSGMTLGTPDPGSTKTGAQNWRGGDRGLALGRDDGLKPVFDFINEVGGEPFFVWYAPLLPHGPHTPPERLLQKYVAKTDSIRIARYWAMCEWFDETVGELLDYLDRKNLTDNTLVVFVGDNGYIPLANAGGPDYARSKSSAYDGGIRTPIMLRWPGQIKASRDDRILVSSIDLAPTILAACDVEATAEMPGLDLLNGEAAARRTAIFGAIFNHVARDIHEPASSLKFRWGIEGRWKLIVADATNVPEGEVELYNLEADPHEERNLAGVHPDRVDRLHAAIDRWWPAK